MNHCHRKFGIYLTFQSSLWTKTTTKVRIVFDRSAKTDGVSLNDAICAESKLQKDLSYVLIRFRKSPIALACRIKEMYLQVEIEQRDGPYFRLF